MGSQGSGKAQGVREAGFTRLWTPLSPWSHGGEEEREDLTSEGHFSGCGSLSPRSSSSVSLSTVICPWVRPMSSMNFYRRNKSSCFLRDRATSIEVRSRELDGRDSKGPSGADRGWDGWMVSPIQWTWTWANFRRWWGTGKLGMLQFMELQEVRHVLATEQQLKNNKVTYTCWSWRASWRVRKQLWLYLRMELLVVDIIWSSLNHSIATLASATFFTHFIER